MFKLDNIDITVHVGEHIRVADNIYIKNIYYTAKQDNKYIHDEIVLPTEVKYTIGNVLPLTIDKTSIDEYFKPEIEAILPSIKQKLADAPAVS